MSENTSQNLHRIMILFLTVLMMFPSKWVHLEDSLWLGHSVDLWGLLWLYLAGFSHCYAILIDYACFLLHFRFTHHFVFAFGFDLFINCDGLYLWYFLFKSLIIFVLEPNNLWLFKPKRWNFWLMCRIVVNWAITIVSTTMNEAWTYRAFLEWVFLSKVCGG